MHHDRERESVGARALWVTGPQQAELRTQSVGPPGPGQVRVRTLYSSISRGTESLVFHGRVPKTEYERMRAPFQEGCLPGPVKYGYSSVGVVEHGPSDLRGRPVFCLYPHQTHYVVPQEAVVPVPDDVPPARAVLTANMETAVNATWDATLSIGDRVAVVGAGVVGCLVAYLARRVAGCDVQLIDIDERKRAIADQLGVEFCSPDAAQGSVDRVFEASGSAGGLDRALRLAGAEASVVVLSWYGDEQVGLPLGEAFHSQRLQIASSQVGQLPTRQRPRWTHRRRLELSLRLLADEALDALITAQHPFDDIVAAMAEATDPSRFVLAHRVGYG